MSSPVVGAEKQKNGHFVQKKKRGAGEGGSCGFSQHSSGIGANVLEGSGGFNAINAQPLCTHSDLSIQTDGGCLNQLKMPH